MGNTGGFSCQKDHFPSHIYILQHHCGRLFFYPDVPTLPCGRYLAGFALKAFESICNVTIFCVGYIGFLKQTNKSTLLKAAIKSYTFMKPISLFNRGNI